jgi:hypothetical protein
MTFFLSHASSVPSVVYCFKGYIGAGFRDVKSFSNKKSTKPRVRMLAYDTEAQAILRRNTQHQNDVGRFFEKPQGKPLLTV